MKISENACLEQIRYWQKAIQQSNKAIRRKNKRINSLQRENMRLKNNEAMLVLRIAELEAEIEKNIQGVDND